MSYCRMNGKDSDVYVYQSVYGGIVCCACRITPVYDWWADVNTGDEPLVMLQHLTLHEAVGHRVPWRALERLAQEQVYFMEVVDVC